MSSINSIILAQVSIINHINEIEALKTASIKVFTSVPSGQKPPYLKINEISISDEYTESFEKSTIGFKIGLITQSRSNKEIISLVESIRENLPNITKTEKSEVNIVDFSNLIITIQDNILESSWIANISFSVDIVKNNFDI